MRFWCAFNFVIRYFNLVISHSVWFVLRTDFSFFSVHSITILKLRRNKKNGRHIVTTVRYPILIALSFEPYSSISSTYHSGISPSEFVIMWNATASTSSL